MERLSLTRHLAHTIPDFTVPVLPFPQSPCFCFFLALFLSLLSFFGCLLAVVLSLIYLAIQIRNQISESRAATVHDISVAHRESVAAISEGALADIFVQASEDYDSLSSADALRMIGFVYRFLKVWEEAYILHQAGRLDDRIWEPMTRQYTAYLAMAPFQKGWELRSDFLDSEFRNYVNSREKVEMDLVYEGQVPARDG